LAETAHPPRPTGREKSPAPPAPGLARPGVRSSTGGLLMAEPAVLYAKSGGVAVVTMNRPEVRNAINAEMLCRLADAWQDVNDDPAIRCAIFTGAGEQAFCAGADLGRRLGMMQGPRPAATGRDRRSIGG